MEKIEKISVALITYNAGVTLNRVLESVKWADEIIIVDSGSKDETIVIARNYTDKIFYRKFDNFSNQKNYAIKKATNKWVLSLDSDEVVSAELAKEIRNLSINSNIDGFYIERLNYIYGRFVKYGRPDYQLRLFRKEKGFFVNPVHERVYLNKNRIAYLKSKLLHYTMQNIFTHIRKIDEFTDYDVVYYPRERITILWLIRKFIFVIPLKFIQHYIFKRGFMDGMLGFIFSVNTVMGEFITCIKYWEKSMMDEKEYFYD
jgi:glycosyltransferase involved in cell wall biosynthesis